MRLSNLFVIAALPAFSFAQSVDISSLTSEVPFCALGPLSMAAGETSCNLDGECLCKDQTFVSSLTAKVRAACSEEELNEVVSLATEACKSAGVTVNVPVNSANNSTDSATDTSTDTPGWGERSSKANLAFVVGIVGLAAAQAVL